MYAAMVGSGRMKKHDAEAYLSDLRRTARGAELPPKGPRPTLAKLRAIGIELVPPPEKEKP